MSSLFVYIERFVYIAALHWHCYVAMVYRPKTSLIVPNLFGPPTFFSNEDIKVLNWHQFKEYICTILLSMGWPLMHSTCAVTRCRLHVTWHGAHGHDGMDDREQRHRSIGKCRAAPICSPLFIFFKLVKKNIIWKCLEFSETHDFFFSKKNRL